MKKFLNLLLVTLCCLSCGEENTEINPPIPEIPIPDTPSPEETPVFFRSKTVDGEFAQDDCVGLYMVNYVNGQQEPLMPNTNYVNNWKFQYDGLGNWSAEKKLYYKDEDTPADFYVYHPYSDIADATSHNVSVAFDQSIEENYKKADFLWGCALNCSPSMEPVEITLDHMMSKVVVVLKPGTGFTEDELIAAGPHVRLLDFKCTASFNLGTGEMYVESSKDNVIPYALSPLDYRAILVPQSFNDMDIIEINVGESVYKLRRTITFERGKEYTLTVTIQRTEGGVNVGIGSWDVVDEDFGGIVS